MFLFLYHQNRRKRYENKKKRKKKPNERSEKYYIAQVYYTIHTTTPSFSFFLFSSTTTNRVVALSLFLLSYLIFQYNYHSPNVIIIHPVQLTIKKSIHTHIKPIMIRSISRWICQIYSVYGLGRQ